MQDKCDEWNQRLGARAGDTTVRIAQVEAFLLRAPLSSPLRNSFRTLTERFALLVRVRDDQGGHGWGEVWCNYPPGGGASRRRLLQDVLAPLALAQPAATPAMHFKALGQALRVPALQCGDHGAFAQVLAGLDQALWDLVARRLGQPLWQLLRQVAAVDQPSCPTQAPRTRAYASGLAGPGAVDLALAHAAAGYRAFKLKVGFGPAADVAACSAIRAAIGSDAELMLDANQRWDTTRAIEASHELAQFYPLWLEEPIAADEPWPQWQRLAAQAPVPLAAGENLRGWDAFAQAGAAQCLRAIQPDPGKWGGFSGVLAVAQAVAAQGQGSFELFCPHWLGGGVGLLAAQHLAAVVRPERSWLEVDANPNPLRSELLPADWKVHEGSVALPTTPGLGFEPDEAVLRQFAAG
jgi:L-alanine-DL-glutamate epimerase-like enolase superfamily enzyme